MDHRKLYFRIAGIYTLVLSVLLLWPFDFDLPFSFEANHVRWIPGTNGVEFPARGIIRAPSNVQELHDALVSGTGITVEVWAATMTDQQHGPARIVSYSKDPGSRNFTLAQDRRELVMRLRTTETDLNGRPVLTVEDVFHTQDPQHLVVTYDFAEQHAYVNGRRRLRVPIPGGNFSTWDASHSLVVGNEATGNRPWLGKLFLVAIYNRPLAEQEIRRNYSAGKLFHGAANSPDQRVEEGLVALYVFNEGNGNRVLERSGSLSSMELEIPSQLRVVTADREFLSTAFSDTFSGSVASSRMFDLFGNIIVFIPFGFLLQAAMAWRYPSSLKIAAMVIFAGSLFTFSIESLQYLLETRYSSMTDVIANIIGTGLGIAINVCRPEPVKCSAA